MDIFTFTCVVIFWLFSAATIHGIEISLDFDRAAMWTRRKGQGRAFILLAVFWPAYLALRGLRSPELATIFFVSIFKIAIGVLIVWFALNAVFENPIRKTSIAVLIFGSFYFWPSIKEKIRNPH